MPTDAPSDHPDPPSRRGVWVAVSIALAVALAALAVTRPWSSEEVGDDTADAVSPATTPSTTTPPSSSTSVPRATSTTTSSTSTTTTTTVAPGPVTLATGTLGPRDYQVSGRVAVVEHPDGRRTVDLLDLASEDGPDLVVWLSTAGAAAPGDEILASDRVDLGPLVSTTGDQSYSVPSDVDLSAQASVVIWCLQVNAPFGTADLVPT